MVRAAFRIEATGQLISCLLNPQQLVFRRTAGVRHRRSIAGAVTAARSADQPLHFSGAGTTELTLDLLFDVSLQTVAATAVSDVTSLTRPLWELAENAAVEDGEVRPPVVRFVWGKAWNFPAVVVTAAERFESFDAAGVPRRSWLRLRLVRVEEPDAGAVRPPLPPGQVAPLGAGEEEPEPSPSSETAPSAPADGDAAEPDLPGQRLDVLAAAYLGDAARWRELADANGVADPMRVPPSLAMRLPELAARGKA